MVDHFDWLRDALADRYELKREIGRGGWATVYLAEEKHPQREVAIKVLDSEVGTSVARQRFLREVQMASKLTHPHILPIFSAGQVGDVLYYVMPYIDGESVRERIMKSGPLPVQFAVEITREVAQALSYAHQRGVIHRDVKPENILLSGGHAIVADFGIARALRSAGEESLTQAGFAVGTPAYMSPEQASASGKVDHRSDIYALGCVLYEMLAGKPPFTGLTPQEIMMRQSLDPVPPLPKSDRHVPAQIRRALDRALAKRAEDRFETADEMDRALATSSSELLGTGFSPGPQLGWRVGGAIGALAIAAAALGFLLGRGNPQATTFIEDRVVVARFSNETGDPELDGLGNMAADWITQGLSRTGIVEVVGSREMMASSTPGDSGENQIGQLAQETGASKVITGSYYLSGPNSDTIRFQSRITDARANRLLIALSPVSGTIDEPLQVVERLRQAVTGALAQVVDPRLSSWASPSSQPPSFEAYQEYVEGMAQFVAGNSPRAIEHFTRAASFDSTFSIPLVFAAFAHTTLGHWREADSLAREVERARGNLSPFDQNLLDWVTAMVRGDTRGMLGPISRAAQLAPESEALSLLGNTYLLLNRPDDALEAYRRLDPDRGLMKGYPFYWVNLSRAHSQLGDDQAALREARSGRERFPHSLHLAFNQAVAAARLGRADEVLELATEILRLGPQAGLSPAVALTVVANHLRAGGRPQAANEILSRAGQWSRRALEQASGDTAVIVRTELAGALYAAGRYREAQPVVAELLRQDSTSVEAWGLSGVIAARMGNDARADSVFTVLGELDGPYRLGLPAYWQARLAAIRGNRDQAVALLRESLRQGFKVTRLGTWQTLDVDPDLRVLAEHPPFRDLIRPRGPT